MSNQSFAPASNNTSAPPCAQCNHYHSTVTGTCGTYVEIQYGPHAGYYHRCACRVSIRGR